jgi:hypothetical protein
LLERPTWLVCLSIADLLPAGHGLFARGFLRRLCGGPLGLCGQGRGSYSGFGLEAGRLVACSNEPPESEESNSLALRFHTDARGAVCRSAGASSLGTADRWPEPFELADASASLFRLSWSISRLNCLSALAGNSTMWAFRKASSSSFIISEWPDKQASDFELPALGPKSDRAPPSVGPSGTPSQ